MIPLFEMRAEINNKEVFCRKWIFNYGGTLENAERVWRMECLENLKYGLYKPYPSDEQLRKAGLIQSK